MILEKEGLFPIVHFDETDGWDSVREICYCHLDVNGRDKLAVALSALVNANRELIKRMEAKIQSVLARIRGE